MLSSPRVLMTPSPVPPENLRRLCELLFAPIASSHEEVDAS